jgi:hypothetical protein
MDKKEENVGKEEGCCESSGGGCGCGGGGCGGGCGHGKSCCAGKTAFALVLLIIGGLIGYGIGHCGYRHGGYCPMAMSAPMGMPSK